MMTKFSPIFNGKTVSVYRWSPPRSANYKNFGDEIGPLLVKRLLELNGFLDIDVSEHQENRNKVIAVGSVIHQAVEGDVVWGGGVNGKSWPRNLKKVKRLDISLVRGPLTRNAILSFGLDCPEVYGDPGLIFYDVFSSEIEGIIASMRADEFADIVYIPNLNDDRFLDQKIESSFFSIKRVSPGLCPFKIAAIVSKSKLVISSSLHGIVFADSLGVPVIPVLSYFEPVFKYVDYFEATGRSGVKFAEELVDALEYPELKKPVFDKELIKEVFPVPHLGLM